MPKKTKPRRRTKNQASASQQTIGSRLQPRSAGIDVGAEELVVAIPPGADPAGCVRTFQSFTRGLEALRDWLVASAITTA